MVRGFLIILLFLGGGNLISLALKGLIPGSVIGMLLMLVALQTKLLKAEWVASTAKALTQNMALFFVPAGVGIMVAFDTLAKSWVDILSIILVSMVAVIAVVGLTHQWIESRKR